LYQVDNTDQQQNGNNGGIYAVFRAFKQEWFPDKRMGGTNELHGINQESPGINR
jgi:hypothetical protein